MPYFRHILVLIIFLIFLQIGAISRVIQRLELNQSELATGLGISIIASLSALQIAQLQWINKKLRNKHSEPLIVGINLGGTLIPLFFLLYFSQQVEPLNELWLGLVGLTTLCVYYSSKVDPKHGVTIYLFSATVCAAIGGLYWGGNDYLFWAYSSAVLGTLIGGDLLHLPDLKRLMDRNRTMILIGAGGVMDAIYLSGFFAMLFAEAMIVIGFSALPS